MPAKTRQRAFKTRGHHVMLSINRVSGLFSRADIARATGRSQARVGQWAETWDWPDPVDHVNGKPLFAGYDVASWLASRELYDAAELVLTYKSSAEDHPSF